MKRIFKHKDKIVSLGLLPIITTLVCLHFLSGTIALGIGTLFSVSALIYGIVRMRS